MKNSSELKWVEASFAFLLQKGILSLLWVRKKSSSDSHKLLLQGGLSEAISSDFTAVTHTNDSTLTPPTVRQHGVIDQVDQSVVHFYSPFRGSHSPAGAIYAFADGS